MFTSVDYKGLNLPLPSKYYIHNHLSVCPYVCLSAGFVGDLDPHPDIKQILDFPIYLLLHVLKEVCNLRVLLFELIFKPSTSDITRDEYDDDKSVIMARIEQITQNLMQFDSRIDENKDGINELRDNTVKRCKFVNLS